MGNWVLGVIGHLGMKTHHNELLEVPPNNSFPARNFSMPKATVIESALL